MDTQVNVSVRELKSHLSELLNKVIAGEQLTVTRHGHPIATVNPVSATVGQDPRDRLARADWITPPSRTTDALGMSDPPQIREGEKTLSDIVIEDRG